MAQGLLVKVRQGSRTSAFAAAQALGPFEPILELPPGNGRAMELARDEGAAWVLLPPQDRAWDRAYSLLGGGFGASEAGVLAVEPDVEFALRPPAASNGAGDRYPDPAPAPGWHLDDRFSGLRTARARVRAEAAARAGEVLVAHLDTGWQPGHPAAPANVWDAQSVDFTSGRKRPGALDEHTPSGFIFQRGHGTGVIGILAGGDPGGPPGLGELGGAPDARILPVRVANSVAILKASGVTAGFDHAIRLGAHVLSMSLGGLPSQALAEAVNLAYDRGIVMVTAAGNYFGGLPSPESIVYPARMRRVIAATGVMADGRAYTGLAEPLMQGCVGPASKMETALAAWTPQIPWAELGGGLGLNGGGTSAATPQIAAAAALWIALNHDLYAAQRGWRRGELVRQALFRSARKRTAALDRKAVRRLLGEGALDAVAALDERPDPATLTPQPEATARLAWLKLLTGQGVGIAAAAAAPRARLLELEALHAMQRTPELQRIVADPDAGEPAEPKRRAFLEALRATPDISTTLANAIEAALSGRSAPRSMPAAPVRAAPPGRAAAPTRPPAPERRRLRIFALDPSLGNALSTVDANIATVDVPYETAADTRTSLLTPGPVGEYLEVVDVDPASDRFYPPVDLDDPHLLLADGLAPSEGNPQFHQQMVYAVGMRTIESFEHALGRPAIWAPRRRPGSGYAYEFVQRLRIYPHALRGRNAYYSPDKVALLFGYFVSDAERGAATPPGSLVFSCLSADIIAHEMTHALLDGYTRSFREDSNPDVGAFHEAFADIVALMQHYQIKDLVRREIAAARADLGAAGLLAGLARQFGDGARSGGPLRNYERSATPPDYRTTFQVHARGSILVRAVYLAFIAIFERRAADLLRLATGGSGLLGPGAIHPDLVERLTQEACTAAGQVLRMVIRALDFICHADVTFGDYLRGLITADLEVIEEDPMRYRTAFLESFRRLDLLPEGLRTVSIETLKWPSFAQRVRSMGLESALEARGDVDAPDWLKPMVDELGIPWRDSPERWEIWRDIEERGRAVARHLRQLFRTSPAWMEALGLAPGLARYARDGTVDAEAPAGGTTFQVRTVRGAQRSRPDGRVKEHIVIGIHQRRPVALDGADVAKGFFFFFFRGATTLIIEPATPRTASPRLRYVIVRDVMDRNREARERGWRAGQSSARAMYFGPRAGAALDGSARDPFAALHGDEA